MLLIDYQRNITHQNAVNKGGPICLWALGISFAHPITGVPVDVDIPEPVSYQRVRAEVENEVNYK